ncbi:MAG TPA: DUF4111 domain-containing protein [Caldisericia bacterium]|nr:DUF4111 domain-containing protein [Caldisericia bacterium]HPF48550.1 DUF4111 domain-containing protein [Caldisericia bacterium]HPI83790.1 DUF4111 domain-containing protein [Caldisericia bacterium]HPQ93005.1 DUF4111 domain-containing protein [Caldisericia bacterium]HRV75162.1 DUF4111 domain-containing protein [Caldisericia bacterium]
MNLVLGESCPKTVREQVCGFVGGVVSCLFGDNLSSVWLHGSLSLGCFNESKSDVDLLFVTKSPLSREGVLKISKLTLRFSGNPRPIELSFVNLRDISPWKHPARFDFHYSSSYRERLTKLVNEKPDSIVEELWGKDPVDSDLAVHFRVCKTRGMRLFGLDDDTLPDVPDFDVDDSILQDFIWLGEQSEEFPIYSVLNTCRIIAFVERRLILSKLESANWASENIDRRYHHLIELASLDYKSADNLDLPTDELSDFINYSRRRLRNHLVEHGLWR